MTATPVNSKRLTDWITWPVVAIVFIGCLTVFALVYWGKQELGAISGFITAIAAVVMSVYLRQVSKDTNGNLTKRDEQIADLQRQLNDLHAIRASEAAQMAKQAPPTASLPPTLAPSPYATGADAFSQTTVQVPTVQRT